MSERSDALRRYLQSEILAADPAEANEVHRHEVVIRTVQDLASNFRTGGVDGDSGDPVFKGWSITLTGRPMTDEGRHDGNSPLASKTYQCRLMRWASVQAGGASEIAHWNHVEAVVDRLNGTLRPAAELGLDDIKSLTAQIPSDGIDTIEWGNTGTFVHFARVEVEAVFREDSR